MAENEVGSIAIGLDIEDTAGEQIENIAKKAVNPAKQSFGKVGSALQQTVDKALNSAFKEPKGFQVAQNALELMEQKLGNIGAQIGSVEKQIKTAEAAYSTAPTENLENELTKLQAKLISLQSASIATEEKLTKAMNAPAEAAKKAEMIQEKLRIKAAAEAEKQQQRAALAAEKAQQRAAAAAEKAQLKIKKAQEKSANAASKNTEKSTKSSEGMFDKMGKSIKGSLKAVFVTAVLYKFFKAFKDNMTAAMQKNKQFAKSLNTIKANLKVAFTPIIEAVMPLINKLAAGLATVTKYIATFIAAIFGKTYKQAVASTKKLQTEAEKAQKSSSRDFDELHNVDKEEKDSSSGGINYDALDTSQLNTGPMQKFQEILEKIRAVIDKVKPSFKELIDKGFKPVAMWLGEKLKDAFAFIGKQFEKLGDWIVEHKDTFSRLGESLGKLWEAVKPFLDIAWETIKNVIGNLFDTILKVGGDLLDICPDIIDFITALLQGDWSGMKEAGKNILEGLWQGIQDMWNGLIEHITMIVEGIIEWFKQLFGIHSPSTVFADMGKNIVQGLIDGIVGLWEKLKTAVSEKVTSLITSVKDKFTNAKTKFVNMLDEFKNTVVTKLGGVWDGIKGFINKVLGGVETMINKPVNALNKFIDKLNSINVKLPDIFGGGTIGFNMGKFSNVSIPRLARGGIVSQPTLSLIGESGREAVVPLENNTGWMDKLAGVISNSVAAAVSMITGNQPNNSQGVSGDLNLNIDGKNFAHMTKDLLLKYTGNKTGKVEG